MPDKISIAITGIGSVSSALIRGLEFYKNTSEGLWHPNISGLTLNDITISAIFDIDASKTGKKLGDLIPSKTDFANLTIEPGIMVDPVPQHISRNGATRSVSYDEFLKSLKTVKPDILVNLISSGIDATSQKYAEASLEVGCSFFNATSARTVTDSIKSSFESKNLMILGDDLMSQFGGTSFHRGMIDFMMSRGIRIQKSYQLDVGGNSDTMNTMSEQTREQKRRIKTESISVEAPHTFRSTAGTTEYAEQLGDSRVSYYWMEAVGFFGEPIEIDLSLRTKDSTNGCNIIVDSVRAAKKALSDNQPNKSDIISAYAFKNPPKKNPIRESINRFEDAFLN